MTNKSQISIDPERMLETLARLETIYNMPRSDSEHGPDVDKFIAAVSEGRSTFGDPMQQLNGVVEAITNKLSSETGMPAPIIITMGGKAITKLAVSSLLSTGILYGWLAANLARDEEMSAALYRDPNASEVGGN